MASANYSISGNSVEVWLDGLAISDANGNKIQWTRRVEWTLYNVSSGNSRQADYTVDISPGNTKGGYYTFKNVADGTYQASARVLNVSAGDYVTTLPSGIFTVPSGGSSGGGAPSNIVCDYQIRTGSRVVTVYLNGTNIKGYTVTIQLAYSDGTAVTRIDNIPITSNSFSTTITAANYSANGLSVVFDLGGKYGQAFFFPIYLDSGDDDDDEPEYFEWSSAVKPGSAIKNVLHDEWNDFIDKIVELLGGNLYVPLNTAIYGYSATDTYNTMLQDCYMKNYDSTLQGYPLTAKMFNVARFIIGSFVDGGTGMDDKISRQSKVLASDFITLENCLKTWQDQ